MVNVSLTDATFAKAKAAAEPLVDSPDSVISRALDLLLKEQGDRARSASTMPVSIIRLAVGTKELTHSRLLTANVGGAEIHRPDWNSLSRDLHLRARVRLGSFEAVRDASSANLRPGRHEDDGYRYLAEADFSIQGSDANSACESSFRLAEAMGIALRVTFEWRDREDAAYPGKTGVIEWRPGETARRQTTFAERQAAMERWKSRRPRLDSASVRDLIREARR